MRAQNLSLRTNWHDVCWRSLLRILYQRPFGFGQLRMESVAQLKPRRTDATEEEAERGKWLESRGTRFGIFVSAWWIMYVQIKKVYSGFYFKSRNQSNLTLTFNMCHLSFFAPQDLWAELSELPHVRAVITICCKDVDIVSGDPELRWPYFLFHAGRTDGPKRTHSWLNFDSLQNTLTVFRVKEASVVSNAAQQHTGEEWYRNKRNPTP